MDQEFKIIVTCCNAEKWILKCIQSIKQQEYNNWQAIIIDAKSDDNTFRILTENSSDKITILQNEKRKTALFNNLLAVESLSPHTEDVLVFLDGDDWFYDSLTLNHVNEIYSNTDVWITWGSYVTYPLNNVAYEGCSQPIPHKDFNLRDSDWIFSHLKTCKFFLWKNIKEEDLRWQKTGDYYPAARDVSFMYPMLEMAGEKHRRFTDKILYVYNTMNELSDGYINRDIQLQCLMDIKKKPSYIEQTKENLLIGCKNEII